MLADYVNIVLLRKQEHSASLAPQKKHVMCDAALPGDAAYAAMRSGAYYMYAACSSAEVGMHTIVNTFIHCKARPCWSLHDAKDLAQDRQHHRFEISMVSTAGAASVRYCR